MQEYIFKVLLLGDSGVGKTHIMLKFVKGTVPGNTEPTIGVDFAAKVVEEGVGADTVVRLQLWDTAGAKMYRHHDPGKVYRHAVCCVLVYDVTERDSFENLAVWLDDLNATSETDLSRMVMVVVGNKCELPDRAVSKGEGQTFASERGFHFTEVSADKNEGITELFTQIAKSILSRMEKPVCVDDTPSTPAPPSKEISDKPLLSPVDPNTLAATGVGKPEKPQDGEKQKQFEDEGDAETPKENDVKPAGEPFQEGVERKTKTERPSHPDVEPTPDRNGAIPQAPKKSKKEKGDSCQCCSVM
eukprot:TRINITY_DN1693_c0_g4_i1.p1 TRINITY_DN1693_c0_g4~~TRINITY_DN1693_c0_g4_i1.p1  ORF type:complete len:319 (+),score=61.45 TRINITY_DN1693_c0_g4_i1:55-957(+)